MIYLGQCRRCGIRFESRKSYPYCAGCAEVMARRWRVAGWVAGFVGLGLLTWWLFQ